MISNKISAIYPRRSVFNRSSEHKFNCDMGLLIPIEIQQMYPGDKVKLSLQALLRTTPLVVPPMHEINAYCQAYFVAYRALDENFEDFISGGEDGQNNYKLPYINYAHLSSSPLYKDSLSSFSISGPLSEGGQSVIRNSINRVLFYSNWDYLGFPIHCFVPPIGYTFKSNSVNNFYRNDCVMTGSNSVNRVKVLAYPFMAIANIWNEYYRDENLEDPFNEKGLADCAFMKPFPVHWNRDYFTNCLPFQQRGISPALPLYGNLQATFKGVSDFRDLTLDPDYIQYYYPNQSYIKKSFSVNPAIYSSVKTVSSGSIHELDFPLSFDVGSATISKNYTGTGQPGEDDQHLAPGQYSVSYDTDGPLTMPVTGQVFIKNNLSAGTIAELRTAFQIQLWQERNARAGVRYTEFIQAHFGIHPLDERLDRPEYIGGCKFPVITNEVIQTSQSTSDSPQGTLAGRGIGVSDQYIGTYTAKEFGVMVVFFYIKPKSNYSSQGVNRQWQVQSRFDFYSPEFAHLSMQGVNNSELYVDSDFTKSNNSEIFGYTGRFDELRTNYTTVSGDFRPDVGLAPYTDWTLARAFKETPTLGPEFIQCKPDKRIFAVQDEPGFLCDIGLKQQWLRPLPTVAEPGFIDHSYY